MEKPFNKVPIRQLEGWARKHLAQGDLIVMEASGHSFATLRKLEALEQKALKLSRIPNRSYPDENRTQGGV